MIVDDDPVSLFLAHHGVLGMHWGVRKEDVASGRPRGGSKAAASGKAAPKKVKVSSVSHATVKVSKTQDTEVHKGDAIVLGAIGVGSIGYVFGPDISGAITAPAYAPVIEKDLASIKEHTALIDQGKDFLRNEVNTDVPLGTVFHRVASYQETEVNAPKYATYLRDDVLRYRNGWVTPGRTRYDKHYVTRLEATKNITIASPDSIRKTLEKELHTVLSDGESMYSKFEKISGSMRTQDLSKYSSKVIANEIIRHNRSAIWGDEIGKATSELMLKAGYSAVTDINNTGDRSRKHAVIILDKEAFKVTSTKLKYGERAAAAAAQRKIAKAALKAVATKI